MLNHMVSGPREKRAVCDICYFQGAGGGGGGGLKKDYHTVNDTIFNNQRVFVDEMSTKVWIRPIKISDLRSRGPVFTYFKDFSTCFGTFLRHKTDHFSSINIV